MPLYKRRPLIVEAHQMTMDHREQEMLASWCHGQLRGSCLPPAQCFIQFSNREAHPSDWIVKEIDGNYYVYKASYFELTHTLTHGSGGA